MEPSVCISILCKDKMLKMLNILTLKGGSFLLRTHTRLYSRLGIILILMYILLFLSTGLDKMATYNPWLAFLVCVALSVGGFVVSILSIIGKRTELTPYLSAFFSFLLILFTIFVFLLPEGGLPPAIPLLFNE